MLASLLLAALPLATPRVAPAVVERLDAGETYVPVVLTLRAADARTDRAALARNVDDALAGLDVTRFAPRHRLAGTPVVSGLVTRAGLDELRRRPGVASITLDVPVRPAGQLGGAQIGADRLAARGLTGYGRSVAIVDSGVDAAHPFLGGGPGPSPRVLGGWNVADGGNDLSDCSGHGTAVAGVAAGIEGVAPEAGIVAVKVFSRRDGCEVASLSDVLAGVDWALDHRDELRIDVINVSLTGDKAYTGFCDGDDPAGREVFARARAAGVAVVAAAGNSGWSDAVSWPACLSDVAAIGMVYSRSLDGVTTAGSTACRDANVGPDVVPCVSNSGSQLAALAPGVDWTTADAGGGLTGFSGTSAAAPAAAGALLLVRQVRPVLDPALSLALLATSGTPVVDRKNGRATPRLDIGAAVDTTVSTTGPCAAFQGSTTACRARIEGVTGSVVSVAAAVTIDHPDPSALEVRLIGPDGTVALLMDGNVAKGHAVRAVFGRTTEPIDSLTRFTGHPAEGTWTLEIVDRSPGGAAGRLVSWALAVEPEGPEGESGRPDGETLLPLAVRGAGRFGAFFDTDLRLFNASDVPATATLRFAQRFPESGTRRVSISIPPLGTRRLDSVVGDTFRTSGTGPLLVEAPESVLGAGLVRTSAPAGGRYHGSLPAVSKGRALALGAAARRFLVPAAAGFRVNLGLVELAGQPAVVQVTVFDRDGMSKAMLDLDVGALATRQVNGLPDALGTVLLPDDRIELRVVGGSGSVMPFVTAVENATGDPTVLYGANRATRLLMPLVARDPEADGFRTDLTLSNATGFAVRVRATYRPSSGVTVPPVVMPLGPGDTRFLEDAIVQLFGSTGQGRGSLELESLDGPALLAATHTSERTLSGRPGLWLESGDGADTPAGGRFVLPFVAPGTDLGLVETTGRATRLRLILLGPDGAARAWNEVIVGPREVRQVADVFHELGDESEEEATLLVEVREGGAVAGYALRQDPRTGDPFVVSGLQAH